VAKGHECFHCKQWIPAGVEHDCWTTTETALTKDLSDDLRDAWERLRETAADFGEQRIYASHHSIMFARKACYFFVRPHRSRLEVVFFLGRTLKSSLIKKAVKTSKTKVAHIVHLVHRDQVEEPVTDWLREAFDLQDQLAVVAKPKRAKPKASKPKAAKPKRRKP
jgi:hypothetical protein